MQNLNKLIICLFSSLCFLFLPVSTGLTSATNALQGVTGKSKYWIFFTDKGPSSLQKSNLLKIQQSLLPRARQRREKVFRGQSLVDETDLPLYPQYLRTLVAHGVRPVVKSKWLNAVSAYVDESRKSELQKLPFVKAIKRVAQFRLPEWQLDERLYRQYFPEKQTDLDYGESLQQNEMIHVPEVHNLGISGQGVLVAVFDTGFHLLHEAFDSLHVIAQYDFINHDENTDNEEGDSGAQNWHGSLVLSILGGYSPGHLIGPAYGADFLLAKTEDVSSETPVEEDNWIAAAEWADSLGADVISSSLGYLDWYTYRDMDGDTAPITRAADLAVKKGIIVVVAAGNEGDASWHYITAPADGDSVIAVGAVQPSGTIANFSSRGPTYDGRIKPEVVAMGTSVASIQLSSGGMIGWGYTTIRGTSASCPQVAGAAALVLSAHPDLTPMQVRQALLATADRASYPDNTYGYGLIDAMSAIRYWGDPEGKPEKTHLIGSYPNPFKRTIHHIIRFAFDLSDPAQVELDVYNILGQKVINLWTGARPAGRNQRIVWDGKSAEGSPVSAGLYFCIFRTPTFSETLKFIIL